MAKKTLLEIKENQVALILEVTEDGEISVDINPGASAGLAHDLCVAIAKKLLYDEKFQTELMEMVEEDGEDME